eukprot:scaffold368_cov258-Pinguiococcus_pyrenoidosus.AAC.81
MRCLVLFSTVLLLLLLLPVLLVQVLIPSPLVCKSKLCRTRASPPNRSCPKSFSSESKLPLWPLPRSWTRSYFARLARERRPIGKVPPEQAHILPFPSLPTSPPPFPRAISDLTPSSPPTSASRWEGVFTSFPRDQSLVYGRRGLALVFGRSVSSRGSRKRRGDDLADCALYSLSTRLRPANDKA